MIGSLTGTVTDKVGDAIIINVRGVGYRVEFPGILPLSDDQTVTLYIHTHIREQELRLFGFETRQQLMLFEQLISVSGVGPKAALGLLASFPYEHIVSAIVSEDARQLRCPGVGAKTAERIVLDLHSKLKKAAVAEGLKPQKGMTSATAEVAAALYELGFSDSEVDAVLPQIITDGTELHDMIKQALKLIQQG
ncbi:MAG: Holliday junction ATP-dependent DNA helicase RuvA [candidate division WS6 bacterium OLB20]|uniref:Holliday junction branch migration complex subunit RuvA n=1 Tax=candidate division WS6 bacterium OLB20 TaxID=1617426 RepID=A0A136LY61_9BACT|nr:MAG: Holliday junction ATP-dependent DNA helicase RuvA [candidate division WS6 bacterium OLB20]